MNEEAGCSFSALIIDLIHPFLITIHLWVIYVQYVQSVYNLYRLSKLLRPNLPNFKEYQTILYSKILDGVNEFSLINEWLDWWLGSVLDRLFCYNKI